MPTLSLNAIQQRIAQQDSELQALRRELEARRSRLQSLTQRKEELQAKLQKIEAEITAVAAGSQRHAVALSPRRKSLLPGRPLRPGPASRPWPS